MNNHICLGKMHFYDIKEWNFITSAFSPTLDTLQKETSITAVLLKMDAAVASAPLPLLLFCCLSGGVEPHTYSGVLSRVQWFLNSIVTLWKCLILELKKREKKHKLRIAFRNIRLLCMLCIVIRPWLPGYSNPSSLQLYGVSCTSYLLHWTGSSKGT